MNGQPDPKEAHNKNRPPQQQAFCLEEDLLGTTESGISLTGPAMVRVVISRLNRCRSEPESKGGRTKNTCYVFGGTGWHHWLWGFQ